MKKQYIVRLTEEEQSKLEEVVKKLKGTSQKVRRANILLKANVEGPNWIDAKIAEAFSCRTTTVEKVRKGFVLDGFERVLEHKKRNTSRTQKTGWRTRSPNHSITIGQSTSRICQLVTSTLSQQSS